MSFRKLLKKYGVKLERSIPSQLLHELTREPPRATAAPARATASRAESPST
jgi:hypothetical protein